VRRSAPLLFRAGGVVAGSPKAFDFLHREHDKKAAQSAALQSFAGILVRLREHDKKAAQSAALQSFAGILVCTARA
jgi:hypothetical protein